MEKKTKNWISNFAISAGSVAALVAPIATTVAYQSKTAAKAPAGINASEEMAAASVYTTPQNLPTHFENSLEGFKGIYQTLERLYPEIKVDYTKLEAFYNAYRAKANNLIAFANVNLTHRSFWSSIWDGIKGVGEAIAGGFVKVADVVTGGQIADVHNAANTLINAASDSFKDATEEMNKVDWSGDIKALWTSIGLDILGGLESAATNQTGLTDMAVKAARDNVIIPIIKQKIANILDTNSINNDMIAAIINATKIFNIKPSKALSISPYSGSEVPKSDFTFPQNMDGAGIMAIFRGNYDYEINFNFHVISALSNEDANKLNNLTKNFHLLVRIVLQN